MYTRCPDTGILRDKVLSPGTPEAETRSQSLWEDTGVCEKNIPSFGT